MHSMLYVSEIYSGEGVEKKLAKCVCEDVCLSVQAFWPLEAKRPIGSGREWHRSMRRNAGTTIVPVT